MHKAVAIAVAVATAFSNQLTLPRELEGQHLRREDALQVWLATTVQHGPGTSDDAGALAARWTAADFERLMPSLVYYLQIVREQETADQARASCSACEVSRDERERLLKETRSATSKTEQAIILKLPRPARLNNLILRGAMLHADTEMFVAKRNSAPDALDPSALYFRAPTPFRNYLRAPGEIMSSADGQYIGSVTRAPHWHMARALLQFITPEPSLDADTRRWYLAVTAFLAARADFANLPPHLDTAQALFPDDAVVAFDRGWQSEAHATPLMQAHARALVEAGAQRLSNGIKQPRASLVDAERHFARAVKLDPGMTEAHIRLAHVRTLLGRPAEAEAAFQNLPLSSDDALTFYAALVHGNSLDALNRLDEAAVAYQRALTLFPEARSANLAMSAVQQKRGDISSSVEFAKRAIQSAETARNFDPFSLYHVGRGRDLHEAWSTFYKSLERPAPP